MSNRDHDARVELAVRGMHCASCAQAIETTLGDVAGVAQATVSFDAEKATVRYRPGVDPAPDELAARIEALGYRVADPEREQHRERADRLWRIARIASGGVLILLSWRAVLPERVPFDVLAIVAVIVLGWPLATAAGGALRRRAIDAPTFMFIGVAAACAIGEFLAGAVIAWFVAVAALLETYTVARSRAAIRDLIAAAPRQATVRRDARQMLVDVDDIRHDDVVLVKSGERIPVDGRIVGGHAAINEATITGEPMPVEKREGDHVFAGTIADLGALAVAVERVGRDTTIGRIIRMVEEAHERKAPAQRVADRFAAYFTPVVIGVALLTVLIWWPVSGEVVRAIRAGITVIVIACPCAVALATPLAVVASIGRASRRGILIKGGAYLEELGNADTVVFDKTGTVTIGRPEVTEVVSCPAHTAAEVLQLVASAESPSEHPLASAIVEEARQRRLEIREPESFEVLRGRGVRARLNGSTVVVGSRELMAQAGIELPERLERAAAEREQDGQTVMLVGHDGQMCGFIAVADVVRDSAAPAVEHLAELGLHELIMLTGDNSRTAAAVARRIGIARFEAEALPEDKVARVRELVEQDRKVIMVGDGINDAPALAEATVGMAMGAAGTDAAIEAADVALMSDELERIAEAVQIGRAAFATIKQNLFIGIAFNVVGMSLAAAGLIGPMVAAAAHVIPDLAVFLNSAKLFVGRRRDPLGPAM
ncbi:MAG: cation-translocating P-type ATPase [Armatimonadota bacterium]|jgi:Cd2+/Zn2+-exporting ATPase/Cu+-exporting ATPase